MAGEFKGIDVSAHNGLLNWQQIKASGIDFAIIRAGFGVEAPNQIDKQFENNYNNAKAAGVKLGAYHYSYAKTAAEAKREAEFLLKIIKGKKFEYPIYFDIEEKCQVTLGKAQCTEIVNSFCGELEAAGYWAGVYSFDSFFATNLDESIQKRYTIWVASVENRQPTSCKTFDVWQHSWIGAIPGSSAKTDLNISTKDFAAIIPAAGKNGYSKGSQAAPQKPAAITQPQYTITFRCGTRGECLSIQNAVKQYVGNYGGTIVNL